MKVKLILKDITILFLLIGLFGKPLATIECILYSVVLVLALINLIIDIVEINND